MNKKYYLTLIIIIFPLVVTSFILTGCDDSGIILPVITTTEVSAKERLDSANVQSTRKYGAGTTLVLIFGKNVKVNGKTDLINTTNIDSIGAWLYIYRAANDSISPFKIFTPDPVLATTDCIEITTAFNLAGITSVVTDTSAFNEIKSALQILFVTNAGITTPVTALIDSDVSLTLASTTTPVIKFDTSYTPSASTINGSMFNSTGTNKTTNMFLIPSLGALHISNFMQNPSMTGFPDDLWIVNYKKTNTSNVNENLVLGTVVQSAPSMVVGPPVNITSKVINLSKYAQ